MNPKTSRRLVPAVTLAILATFGPGAGPRQAKAAAPADCDEVDSTVTCVYLSGDNVFAVPAGVTSLHLVAIGGHGGQNGFGVEGNTNSVAGHGAVVTADLAVTPGSSLRAVVGGNGTMEGTGGTNGAGANGGGAGSANFSPCLAGGGGGASDIRLDATLASRVLVAAGGGGAGCDGRAVFNGQTYSGTAFGGDAGADGTPQPPSDVSHGSGGQAGCPVGVTTGCGAGGQAGTTTETFGGHPVDGGDGAIGRGGDAAFGYSASGGGGGGGYSGGGAGGGNGCVAGTPECQLESGAGGGGGSSLVPAGGTLAIDTAGVPKIVISYTAPTPPAPAAHLDTIALSFGSQAVGSTSAAQIVTLSNTGTGPLTVASAAIVGSNVTDFRRAADSCTGASVAPGSICTVSVAFHPTTRGARSAILRFTDDAGDSPQDVSLSGSGAAPIASLSVTTLDFGNVVIGQTSAHRRLTITNTGDAGQDLFLTSETITGLNASEFAFAGDTCITNFIASGAGCTIDFTFTPSAAGLRSATLTITDNALNSPHTVSLTGTGATPSADLAVSIAASPNPVKAGSKVTYTITIFNAGPSSASSILVNDSLSSQSTFVSATISQGSCVTPVKGASGVVTCAFGSLASGASQPIQVVVTVIAKKNSITNSVTVSAATADPNLTNNTASITTRVK